ncbi:MAG TPA: Uma2 family endonuclease [Abditibacterium sp.]|jgi:Uma2 family endonuclease
MSAQLKPDFISEQEYFDGEEVSPIKHEWFDGEVFAMAGGSFNHTTICGKVFAAINSALRGRSCKARSGEQRVKVEASGLITYPDAVIFCPPSRFEGSNSHTLLTPKVIFEVLSDSTERYDRGDKFRAYAQIETFTDYVLIDQNRVTVEHFRRTPDGWLLNTYLQRTDSLRLENVQIEVPLDLIYEELEFPETPLSRPIVIEEP